MGNSSSPKSRWPLRSALAIVVTILGCLIILLFDLNHSDDEPNLGVKNTKKKQVRATDLYEKFLEESIADYQRSKRERKPAKGGYKMTKPECESFLSKRGNTPSSLLFVLICSKDKAYLDMVKSMPDSPLKYLTLLSYSTDKKVRLDYAAKLYAIDPNNKISALSLVKAMSDNGMNAEASEMLSRVGNSAEFRGYQNKLMEEFAAAQEIFGKERSFELMESHGDFWTVNQSKEYTGTYLDSFDLNSYVAGDRADLSGLRGIAEKFLWDLGVSTRRLNQEALLETRDAVLYYAKQNPSPRLDGLLKGLNEELNSGAIGSIKESATVNRMNEEKRGEYILKSFGRE